VSDRITPERRQDGPRGEAVLWRRWAEDRDPAARDALVDLYLPVARRMAKRYAGVAEPYDDLLQVASIGLLNAIDRFDPSHGTPFLGFAKPTIMGELKRHLRDRVWTVRLPRSLHDLLLKIERTSEDLTVRLGRPPTVPELSRQIGVDPHDVVEALEAQHNRSPLSLNAPAKDADGEEGANREWVGGEDPGYASVDERQSLRAALPGLEEEDARILRMRFLEDLSQARIAEIVGCSQMNISRVLRRTLESLRTEMEA
jgi:RNA polymerase sigma-B factor